MTHSKWVFFSALVLVVLGTFTGAFFTNGNPTSIFVLPTLIPTVPLPTQPPTATPIPSSTPVPPTPTQEPPTLTPTSTPSPTSTATRAPRPTVTSTATSIPVPSATFTVPPTDTPIPSPTATLIPTVIPPPIDATAAISGSTPVPTSVPIVEMAPNTINIAVLGSDRRPDWSHWRVDVIQIVSIQPLIPAVTVLSIPRDLYVYVPTVGMERVNVSDMYGEIYGYEGGGFGLLKDTLLYNLGIPIHHYVRTDFDGLIGIVDAMEGVDIPVHCYLYDHWPYPDENGEYPIKEMQPGMHHMDGETALWYARSRKTSSVFARERRQQQVLQAIWRKGRSLDLLPRFPELWGQLQDMIVTDMQFSEVAMLVGVAFRLDEQTVRFRNIGRQHVYPWTTPQGGYVFLPNWEEIGPVVSEALGPVPEGRLWRRLQMVEVWNGTTNEGWDQMAADRLFQEGFGVSIGEPDRRDYTQTQLVDFSLSAKGSAVSYLQATFGIPAGSVISSPDAGRGNMPYRLIVGADYKTCPTP